MNTATVEQLLEIGIALSKEKDNDHLLELILTAAMDITHCDAGTLYRKGTDTLDFQMMFTRSLGTKQGGHYAPITLPPVPLTRENVCSRAVLDGTLINIGDVYQSDTFDFSGPKNYDALTNYKTTSMLVVPMEDDQGHYIGVLQLINALDEQGGIIPFDQSCEQVIRSLASQTAICQVNVEYAAEVQELLDSFVRVMCTTIDALTPYNANHTRNMVKYSKRFMDWLEKTNNDWQFNGQMRRQFLMSVWLHDAGKLTVPLEVMNKDTRLGDDLFHLRNRFVIIGLRNELAQAQGKIDDATYAIRQQALTYAQELVERVNGMGYLSDEALAQINDLAQQTYLDEQGQPQPWLKPHEVTALSVRTGTLTADERHIMEDHVVMTQKMLQEIKFPANYAQVNQWAGSHHEFLNGTGYPQGLSGAEIPPEVRLLTILDIFDALTADRPYKPAMAFEEALTILDEMQEEGKLDAHILALFKESRAWERSQ